MNKNLVTSKEIVSKLGLSSAKVLSKWNSAGLIPRPKLIAHEEGAGSIAAWPAWVLDRCEYLKALEDAGYRTSELVQLTALHIADCYRQLFVGYQENLEGIRQAALKEHARVFKKTNDVNAADSAFCKMFFKHYIDHCSEATERLEEIDEQSASLKRKAHD